MPAIDGKSLNKLANGTENEKAGVRRLYPITVIYDDSIGRSKVDAEPSCTSTQDKDKPFLVLIE